MTTWPTLNSSEVVRALKKAVFRLVRQKGSHARFEYQDGRSTTVPIHGSQDIGRGLLRKILPDIEVDLKEFSKYL